MKFRLPPLHSRFGPLFAGVAVLLSTVAGGTLQCDPQGEVEARGRHVYSAMCSVCHGANGEGYKADHAPALAQQDFLASVSDEYLASAITDGRWGTTMSAWGNARGGPLSRTEVTAVVTYLRSLAEHAPASLDTHPLQGDTSKGDAIFAKECAGCHGPRGAGAPAEGIAGAQLLTTASDGFLRYAIDRGRFGTPMPSFREALGVQGIDDVLATLRAWQATPAPAQSHRTPPVRTPPLPLGPVPLNPHGPEPQGFHPSPAFTSATVIKAELDRGARMGVLDARAPSDYANEHIPGAVSVPFYDPSPYVDQLPKDAWLVCYCGCPHAESGQLAAKLVAKGFTKVTVLDEGLGFWRSKKYGTTSGISP